MKIDKRHIREISRRFARSKKTKGKAAFLKGLENMPKRNKEILGLYNDFMVRGVEVEEIKTASGETFGDFLPEEFWKLKEEQKQQWKMILDRISGDTVYRYAVVLIDHEGNVRGSWDTRHLEFIRWKEETGEDPAPFNFESIINPIDFLDF